MFLKCCIRRSLVTKAHFLYLSMTLNCVVKTFPICEKANIGGNMKNSK